ncbi:MAG: N-acetyltransferase, partial [Lacticaseibacillus paracasei]
QYAHPLYAEGMQLQDMVVLRRRLLLTSSDKTKE